MFHDTRDPLIEIDPHSKVCLSYAYIYIDKHIYRDREIHIHEHMCRHGYMYKFMSHVYIYRCVDNDP